MQELLDNVPYLLMGVLGSAIILLSIPDPLLGSCAAALYFIYCLAGALWVMLFVCPYCRFFDSRLCPCGYGQLAARLRKRGDEKLFARKFRRHIPVIVPLWFIPVIVGVVALLRDFRLSLLVLVIVFAFNSFVVLPLLSRVYGCAHCSQKEDCPWMGGSKQSGSDA